MASFWDEYQRLPEVRFFLRWWWLEAIVLVLFALALVGIRRVLDGPKIKRVSFDASAPDGFHCEVCKWWSGPDETDDCDAYDRLADHVKTTGHHFHNRGPA